MGRRRGEKQGVSERQFVHIEKGEANLYNKTIFLGAIYTFYLYARLASSPLYSRLLVV